LTASGNDVGIAATQSTIVDCIVFGIATDGIEAGEQSFVARCSANTNGFIGIIADTGSNVQSRSPSSNTNGFLSLGEAVFSECSASANAIDRYELFAGVVAKNCQANGNLGAGFMVSDGVAGVDFDLSFLNDMAPISAAAGVLTAEDNIVS